MEQCSGCIGADYTIQKFIFEENGINLATTSPKKNAMVLAAAREQIMAMGLILGANQEGHGAMIHDTSLQPQVVVAVLCASDVVLRATTRTSLRQPLSPKWK